MTPVRIALVLASVLTLPVLAAPQQQQQTPPRPTFRASADVVPVHVSVRVDRSMVSGLAASDFQLYDNGVPQTITAVSADSLAVDVTLVVDTSGSVVRSIGRFKSDVRDIVKQLRRDEQVRLLTFDTELRQVFPMQGASQRVPVDEIRTGNLTSLLDAMLFALARAPRPDRRHLVMVFTDGYDNASLIGYRAIAEVANHADATLYVVLVKIRGAPADKPKDIAALADASARTGGTFFPPSDDARDIPGAFKQVLDAFRHGYVLYFTPANVAREGWHDLTVRVTKPGTYDVRARQGYFGG